VRTDAVDHIPEDRIIRIVADTTELTPEEKAHLDQCGHCRNMLAELEGDLHRLRRQAAQAAPAPERRFVLPVDRSRQHPWHRWRWGWAALGTAASAALLILFLQVGGEDRLPGLPPTGPTEAAWVDPEMEEVNRLAENALPEAYLALSEGLEGGYDEGFIDFLIPPLGSDPVS
jgi:hypothetical protein